MIRLIDIDRELKSLKTEYKPDESLRRQTRSMVISEIENRKAPKKTLKKTVLIYSPAVAFVLALVLCISIFTAAPAKAAGYYTIDINPSISLSVDENDAVISAEAENVDAKKLLESLEIKGMQFEEALKEILRAAVEMDYLKDNGHVLIAHFGDGQGMTQEELVSIVSTELPDAKISALSISGSADDFKNAEKTGKKAGIELLMKRAAEQGIGGQDADAVINIMGGKAVKGDKENNGKDKNNEDKRDNNVTQNNGGNGSSNTPGSANPKNSEDTGNNGKNSEDTGNNGKNGNGESNSKGNKDKDKDHGKTKPENSNKGKNN